MIVDERMAGVPVEHPKARHLLIRLLRLDGTPPKTWVRLGALLLAVMVTAPFLVPAAEDAAILDRYADNVALSHVITYNSGGVPVNGATDFLWMILISLFRTLHLPAQGAVGVLNGLSLVGIACIFGAMLDCRLKEAVLFYVIATSLSIPQTVAALSGFSVLAFAFLLLLMLYSFVQVNSKATALASLALCLLRPDGLVFAVPILVAAMLRYDWRDGWLRDVCLSFCLPWTAFWIWQSQYFHAFWPLPFLVKSQAVRWHGLFVIESVEDLSRYFITGLFLLVLFCGKRLFRGRNLDIFLATILIPSLFYARMRLDQNLADRFFVYLVAVPAFLLVLNRHWFSHRITSLRMALFTTWLLALAWPLFFAYAHLFFDRYETDGILGASLKRSGLQGTMLVTEAGKLPMNSGWQAIDLWGLNTREFSVRLPLPDDIVRINPDLMVLHANECAHPDNESAEAGERSWDKMIHNALLGASRSGRYSLVVLPYNQQARAQALERVADGSKTHLCVFVNQTSYNYRTLLDIVRRYR